MKISGSVKAGDFLTKSEMFNFQKDLGSRVPVKSVFHLPVMYIVTYPINDIFQDIITYLGTRIYSCSTGTWNFSHRQ
jgi:hypothetical protein